MNISPMTVNWIEIDDCGTRHEPPDDEEVLLVLSDGLILQGMVSSVGRPDRPRYYVSVRSEGVIVWQFVVSIVAWARRADLMTPHEELKRYADDK